MSDSDPDDPDRPKTMSGGYRGAAAEWVLLRGNRNLLALCVAAVFGVLFSLLLLGGAVPLGDAQSLFYAYSGLIAGNLTLITVVVSINQLLLSRELATPGEIHSQIENVADYRERVEDATGEIAPVEPLGFLRLLVDATREEAQRLGGFAKDGVVAAGEEEIDEVAATLTDQMDEIDALLDESDVGTFGVLSLLLETNYAHQINRLRELQQEYEAEFAEEVHESIDDLVDRLQEIDVARQYFKSIYLQQELSSLSRILLYAGLPAEAVALATLLLLTVPSGHPGQALGLPVLLPVTLTIGVLPLAILSAFILRTATVMRLTAATLPFTTPEQER